MREEERRVLAQYHQRDIGTVALEAKYTFLAGAGGLVLGFVWLAAFHFGDRGASFWPIVALAAAGAALGLPFDLRRRRARLRERQAAAAARWGPVEAVGVVEHIVAEASKAARIDDNQANTAWFLQVDVDQVLCIWDWAEEATDHVEIDLIPGPSPTPLAIRWPGKKLAPIQPERKFRRGEREPGSDREERRVPVGGSSRVRASRSRGTIMTLQTRSAAARVCLCASRSRKTPG